MEYCISFSAINMAGPRITLIRPPILSDPITGMRRSGMRGINAILNTGRVLNKGIPIGADIALVSVMTRIFIIRTIAARGKVGIKDSRASVLLEPLLVMISVVGPILVMTSVVGPILVMTTVLVGPPLLLTSIVGPFLVLTSVVGPFLVLTSVVGPLLVLTSVVGPLLLLPAVPLLVVI